MLGSASVQAVRLTLLGLCTRPFAVSHERGLYAHPHFYNFKPLLLQEFLHRG
jgi:hypothetical protein